MPNINAFNVVVHEKKIFKGSCYINLNKRPMGPVSLTCFRLQNYLKVFAIPETLF